MQFSFASLWLFRSHCLSFITIYLSVVVLVMVLSYKEKYCNVVLVGWVWRLPFIFLEIFYFLLIFFNFYSLCVSFHFFFLFCSLRNICRLFFLFAPWRLVLHNFYFSNFSFNRILTMRFIIFLILLRRVFVCVCVSFPFFLLFRLYYEKKTLSTISDSFFSLFFPVFRNRFYSLRIYLALSFF